MLTVEQAAVRLGVGVEQVRRLARAGKLPASKIGRTVVFDDDVIDARARLELRAGRTLAPRSAWAALWLLSGRDASWLPAASRSRLKARLRSWDAQQLVAGVRMRATRYDLRVLPTYRHDVLSTAGVVGSGMTAAAAIGADIVASSAVDEVYCSEQTLGRLRRDLGLSERGEANIVVRVPSYDDLPLIGHTNMPAAVVAVDLAESAEVRTRRAGVALLTAALRARG